MKNKVVVLSIAAILLKVCVLGITASVDANQPVREELAEEMDEFTRQVLEWNAQGIDANHTVVSERMMAAIRASSDRQYFASMHIDREKRILGTLVFSFTQEPSLKLQNKLIDLKDELVEIEIRVVKYTRWELYIKQDQVHRQWEELAEEGINITTISSDIINNAVEIGIYPFTEAHAERLTELFGEMISVTEQLPVTLVSSDRVSEVAEQESGDSKQGFLLRMWSWIVRFFEDNKKELVYSL